MTDKPVEQRLRTMALPDQDGHRPWFWATLAEAADEIERLKAIVDKLPKTADGLVVIPGRDQVFSPKGQGMEYELWWGPDSFDDERHGQWLAMDENYRSIGGCSTYFPLASDCYSTREAAEGAEAEAAIAAEEKRAAEAAKEKA